MQLIISGDVSQRGGFFVLEEIHERMNNWKTNSRLWRSEEVKDVLADFTQLSELRSSAVVFAFELLKKYRFLHSEKGSKPL